MERKMVADAAQIYKLWNEYTAACLAGDFERYAALWVEDGRQMAPDEPQRIGKEKIREAVKPSFDQFVMSNMLVNTEEVRVLGDWAYSHGTYTFDMTPKEGGETMSISGKYLDILQRQPDGSWKMAIDCHNYNEPYTWAPSAGALE